MFASIISSLIPSFVDTLIGKVTGLFEAYIRKEVSIEELRTRLTAAALESWADVEKSHAESLSKTYDSFIKTAATNRTMTAVWATVASTQLAVLLWHQIGIPAIVALGIVDRYPSSGTTVDWAYALLMFCLGGGAIMLRTGDSSGRTLLERLKSVIGK